MEENAEHRETNPTIIFMAFGTQGDVYPLAAVAAGLARRCKQLSIFFITHSAHENLINPLSSLDIAFVPVSSPPVLSSTFENNTVSAGIADESMALGPRDHLKLKFEDEHREQCLDSVNRIMGDDFQRSGHFIVINFFALEGWHLAELFGIPCVIAAPYVVPYSAPATFERRFQTIYPHLYEKLKKASPGKVGWDDVMHWMWPLFSVQWSEWRSTKLHLSPCPFTDDMTVTASNWNFNVIYDPITEAPLHNWPDQTLVLYGFSKQIVECPLYWPRSVRICGFWYWESNMDFQTWDDICHYSGASQLLMFIRKSSSPPIFIGLSSIGRMGLLDNPKGMLSVLEATLIQAELKAILFTASYPPLDTAVQEVADNSSDSKMKPSDPSNGIYLFGDRLFCFSGSVPYLWLFPQCSIIIHHGGSGTTAASLRSGVPQIICPFIMDQFYWAERMAWLGVSAPEPLQKKHLLPSSSLEKDLGVKSLLSAISKASSPEVKACAAAFGKKLKEEDGVQNAIDILFKLISTKL